MLSILSLGVKILLSTYGVEIEKFLYSRQVQVFNTYSSQKTKNV